MGKFLLVFSFLILLLPVCKIKQKIDAPAEKETAFLSELIEQKQTDVLEKPAIEETKIVFDEKLTSLSLILAGMVAPAGHSINSDDYRVMAGNAYSIHYQEMQKAWRSTETKRLQKIRDWVEEELSDFCNAKETVFYPFSGPDFLNVQLFFPCGKEYILFGLEPPGRIPDIHSFSEKQLAEYFYHIRDSLRANLEYSFFRTNDMKQDFFKELDGVLPALFVFLGYNHNRIVSLQYVAMTSGGIQKANSPRQGGIQGVEIQFVHSLSPGVIRRLYYFQVNVSDEAIGGQKYFFHVLKTKAPFLTYIKSASYLMHSQKFSLIRSFLLETSNVIVQDDSGIPVKYFMDGRWDLRFYGNYVAPIKLFRNRYQPELRKIYLTREDIKPLPFGTGYQFQPGSSNMLVAKKKL